jgi:ATP-dependent RNA helicase SUPV3L1/SUV3
MPASLNVTAVLGPTNTGKTHLAVERMLAHGSGMIGLPLRLLAREIYDRVRLRTGDHQVALITGEERIIPAAPRYWVCTVEAMPADIEVAFLAIDEVQLAADFDRGHIFTDRILNRRGREETMLLGAGTMRGMIEKLLPNVHFQSRPRLSKLTYAGQKKITRLPRRTAVVAFSADMVYATAEVIRRQRGGTAVVLGALSPRSRNAQVALYQSGDVDYLVATDAIGMGLNMDVDHVAFAATRKFDGFQFRQLNPAELGQIAGRAGRFMNDGTFGVTGMADPLPEETIDRLENHHFEPVRMLQWRNTDLDFRSLEALQKSLNRLPQAEGLTRAQPGSDVVALEYLSRDPDVVPLATSREAVTVLWDTCQIPDYRNISAAEHAGIAGRIYQFLRSGNGTIDEDWFARQIALCDKSDGDLDTLSNRISHIRTWTFVANRENWLKAPLFWQHRAREIEDKLSDALHERLTQRFIDRRTSVLMKRLAERGELMSTVEEDGSIRVEGEYAGRIEGFQFVPDTSADGSPGKALKAATLQAVAQEIAARAQAVAASADPDLSVRRDGGIIWNKSVIGRLRAASSLLKPRPEIVAGDQLNGPDREAVQARLEKFTERYVARVLEPLIKLEEGEGLEGAVRGIAFRLVESLGVVPREQIAEEVKSLSQDDRAKLRVLGVRFGAISVYVPLLLKPAATELRLLLWALQLEKENKLDLAALPQPPGQGLTSAAFDRSTPRGFYGVCGYRICGPRVVRIDMLERLADLIRDRVFWRPRFPEEPRPAGSVEGGGFTIVPDMMSLVGCSGEEFQAILRSLEYRSQKKKIRKPAAQPAPASAEAPQPVAPDADAVPVAVADEVQADAPDLHEGHQEAHEHAAEAPAEVSSGDQPAAEAPEAVTADAAAEAAPAAEAVEEIEVEVWWPRDTGPFRRRMPEKRPERRAHPERKADQAGQRPRKGGPSGNSKGKPERERPKPPRKPERAPDPLSPFAVLGSLKAKYDKT